MGPVSYAPKPAAVQPSSKGGREGRARSATSSRSITTSRSATPRRSVTPARSSTPTRSYTPPRRGSASSSSCVTLELLRSKERILKKRLQDIQERVLSGRYTSFDYKLLMGTLHQIIVNAQRMREGEEVTCNYKYWATKKRMPVNVTPVRGRSLRSRYGFHNYGARLDRNHDGRNTDYGNWGTTSDNKEK
ncbi:hypothetical protein Q1695_000737 [Nippostrongylus brasiliensis]|nr:hypothetical protein Q1695_000737 [Nippostrongylus brasiliensis]